MTIKNIEIVPIKPHQGLIGIVHLEFENSLYLGSIGLHRRMDGTGYRITYPTKKVGERNIAIYHPINKLLSKEIETTILQKAAEMFG